MKRKLPQAPAQGLGAPTIMDRALAAAHGSPYVHLAVFAIDIDRIYTLGEEQALPFGWEVFLTELQVMRCIEPLAELQRLRLLEDICLSVLEQAPDAQALGSQLVFAVYDGVVRGTLPPELSSVFRSWHSPPRELVSALGTYFDARDELTPRLVDHCLRRALSPPLSELTRAALQALRDAAAPA